MPLVISFVLLFTMLGLALGELEQAKSNGKNLVASPFGLPLLPPAER